MNSQKETFNRILFFYLLFLPVLLSGQSQRLRQPVDTVGFATLNYQMDSLMSRITQRQGPLIHKALADAQISSPDKWKVIISLHDDYTYVGYLYPATFFSKALEISQQLASAIYSVADERNWKWGTDYALVISSDAMHYGDEGWGGSNYAFCGADSAGYRKAVSHEWEIIHTLSGKLNVGKVRQFTSMTLDDHDFRIYKWTWCGRYSIPVGLLTSYYLTGLLRRNPLHGITVGYSTSIERDPVPVRDIGMGVTAPATLRHWVGYAAIGYK